MSVQGGDQRRPRLDQADPRVATAVDPTLVAPRQAKPTLQVEVILDRFQVLLADEQAGQEAEHHPGHAVADRVLGPLESSINASNFSCRSATSSASRVPGRGHLRNHFHIPSDRLLLLLDFVQALLDASGQAAELLLGEPPFFAPSPVGSTPGPRSALWPSASPEDATDHPYRR